LQSKIKLVKILHSIESIDRAVPLPSSFQKSIGGIFQDNLIALLHVNLMKR
jgi:hypothetical protein